MPVEFEATFLGVNLAHREIKLIKIWNPPRSLHSDARCELTSILYLHRHAAVGRAFDAGSFGTEFDVYTYSSRMLNEPQDQVLLELGKRLFIFMQDRNGRTGARRDMSELEGNVAAAEQKGFDQAAY
jgi:hypothetical protein